MLVGMRGQVEDLDGRVPGMTVERDTVDGDVKGEDNVDDGNGSAW
jgi:hypothetical protein